LVGGAIVGVAGLGVGTVLAVPPVPDPPEPQAERARDKIIKLMTHSAKKLLFAGCPSDVIEVSS
jgi:hypothetical protein